MERHDGKLSLAVVVSTFHRTDLIWQFVWSLTNHVDFKYDLTILSFDTTDKEKAYMESAVRPMCPDVDILYLPDDLLAGINEVAFSSGADVVSIWNDDVVFLPSQPTFFDGMMALFDYPSVGMVGPCTNEAWGLMNLRMPNCPILTRTTALTGGGWLVRKSAFDCVGGLDRDVADIVDIDFCFKVVAAGYDVIVDRRSYIHHIGGGTRLAAGHPDYQETLSFLEEKANRIIRRYGVKAWYDSHRGILMDDSYTELQRVSAEPPVEWKPNLKTQKEGQE